MVKLSIDLAPLHRSVQNMISIADLDALDRQLRTGLPVSIENITVHHDLLFYHYLPVLIYIPDQGKQISAVLKEGAKGKRYHIAYCNSLHRSQHQPYHAIRVHQGQFKVHGLDRQGQPLSGEANLKVCKNCLYQLDYGGYAQLSTEQKNALWLDFKPADFFRYAAIRIQSARQNPPESNVNKQLKMG